TPDRQNRRTPLIEAALAPALDRIRPNVRSHLVAALALIVGTEAMLVFKDVLQMDDEQAAGVKRWAIRALVEAAVDAEMPPPAPAAHGGWRTVLRGPSIERGALPVRHCLRFIVAGEIGQPLGEALVARGERQPPAQVRALAQAARVGRG